MKIQVLGSGCKTCKKMHLLTEQAAQELEMKEEVEYCTDVTKIIEMGVMQTPVLAVDGQPILTGASTLEQIKAALVKQSA